MFFIFLQKVKEVKIMRFNLLHWKGLLLTGHSEKGYQFQNVEYTV